MKTTLRVFSLLAIVVVGFYFTLGPKKIQWSEEVELNTGETLWVERSVIYTLKGDAGNPMDLDFRPSWSESISFQWKGRSYEYEGDADLMVLAIAPTGRPTLIAPAGNKDWNWRHGFPCVTPFYVQLVPNDEGAKWHWPAAIELWTVGLPRNLMGQRKSYQEMAGRYTASEKRREDQRGALAYPPSAVVDAQYASKNCRSATR